MYEYKKILFFASILLLILTDQVSKYIIRTQGGFYICNKGVAFGLNIPTIMITSIVLVLFLLFIISNYKYQISNQFRSSKSKNFVIWIWDLIGNLDFGIWIYLILAGGISNLIDRAYLGCVIDFIDLKFWPVFNLADIYITIGAIVLMISYVFQSPVGRDHRPQK